MARLIVTFIAIVGVLTWLLSSSEPETKEPIIVLQEIQEVEKKLGGTAKEPDIPVEIYKTKYTKLADYKNKKNDLIAKVRNKTPLTDTEYHEFLAILNVEMAGRAIDYGGKNILDIQVINDKLDLK